MVTFFRVLLPLLLLLVVFFILLFVQGIGLEADPQRVFEDELGEDALALNVESRLESSIQSVNNSQIDKLVGLTPR